jgi:hypothetical protein
MLSRCAYLVKACLELVDLGLLDKNVFFIELFDNELVVVLAVLLKSSGWKSVTTYLGLL